MAVKDEFLFIPSTFKPLPTPISLDGVGGGVNLTHYGRLIHLPYPFNLAYYSADLRYNLFSLGVIQRLGGFYTVDPDNQQRLLIKTSKDGSLIATATLSSDNLLPITLPLSSPTSQSQSSFSSSALILPPLLTNLTTPSSPAAPVPPSPSTSLFSFTPAQLTSAGYTKRANGSIIATPFPSFHVNLLDLENHLTDS